MKLMYSESKKVYAADAGWIEVTNLYFLGIKYGEYREKMFPKIDYKELLVPQEIEDITDELKLSYAIKHKSKEMASPQFSAWFSDIVSIYHPVNNQMFNL